MSAKKKKAAAVLTADPTLEQTTVLQRVRDWIATYSGYDILANFLVDYTDQAQAATGGIFPSGLTVLETHRDILGNVWTVNQYNFGIYTVFFKPDADDTEATANAEWVADFQRWVQEQWATGQAPVFGDRPREERISAQNGVMYAASEEGTAVYMVQLSVVFVKDYPNNLFLR